MTKISMQEKEINKFKKYFLLNKNWKNKNKMLETKNEKKGKNNI